MRDCLELSLPDTCVISRASTVVDGMGGRTETWATVHSGVSCRVSPSVDRSENERQTADRDSSRTRWIITVPDGTDLLRTDRVTALGRTFEVNSVYGGRTWDLGFRADLLEIA